MDSGFDIYLDLPGTLPYVPSPISSSDATYSLRSFAWKSTKILNTTTAMKLSSHHRRKQQASYPLSWNSQDWDPSESIPYDADHVKPFNDTPHYNPTSSLGMPRSGYSPRQSIPSDVSTPTRSFSEAEASTDPDGIYRGGKRGSFVIKRWEDYDTSLNAIDPATFSAIVNFDYSCLDDLDEELILRPKTAFADLCWSAVLRHPSSFQRPPTSKNPLPSHLTQRQPWLEGSITKDSVPPPYSYVSPATKDTSPIRGRLEVDILSVSDDDRDSVDTGMETDHLTSTSCGSVEYSAVMMVTGRRSLNALEAHFCSDEENTSTGVVLVPPGSMSPVPIRDNPADSRIDVTGRYVDLSGKNRGQPMRRKEKIDADAGSFISFEAGDDTSPLPPTQDFSSFFLSNLHAYAGVANHRESIGLFPIPASESKTASKLGQSLKLSSKHVGSLKSSVSKLCHPLSSRVVKG